MVATEASVGVTGIMAVLMEFKMEDKKRYFFSCFLISVTIKEKAENNFYIDDEEILKKIYNFLFQYDFLLKFM